MNSEQLRQSGLARWIGFEVKFKEQVMALTIIWRNPIPMQQSQRRWKIFKKSERNLYTVQELIARDHTAVWSSIPKLELVHGGSAPVAAERRAAG